MDIAGYNYYGEYYEDLHALHPERVLVGTETEGNKLSYHYEKMKRLPYLIGDFVWTLQDHLGECNCCELRYGEAEADKSYPWIGNWCGKLDLIGQETVTAHRYRMVWGLERGITLAAQPPVHGGVEAKFNNDRETDAVMSWTFEGLEGKETYIDAVSDAPYVELFVNGVSLGKKATEDFAARFPAVYRPGEVLAVGYGEDGAELYRSVMRTAGRETALSAVPDKTALRADGQDMCFIEISVQDDSGTVKALPERRMTVSVTGAATLAAIGSGAYKTEENYTGNTAVTCNGRCLAVVRSITAPGKAVVRIESEGLSPWETELDVTD